MGIRVLGLDHIHVDTRSWRGRSAGAQPADSGAPITGAAVSQKV